MYYNNDEQIYSWSAVHKITMNIVFLELGSVPSEIQLQSSKTQFKIGKGAEMGLTSKIKETLETNVKLKPLHIKRQIFRKSILLKSIVLLE